MSGRGAVTAENLAHLADLPIGWAVLWVDLLSRLPGDYHVHWAAQKLGGLRLSPIGDHSTYILEAQQRSMRTCAACGAPAKMTHRNGVYLPHCERCAMAEGFAEPPSRKQEG